MDFDQFKNSLKEKEPDSGLPRELKALWYDARGDWNKAHELIQDETTRHASWIHAYLHRKEGDIGNAMYWYSKARKPLAQTSLSDEWEGIVRDLIQELKDKST